MFEKLSIKEIKDLIENVEKDEYLNYIDKLRMDKREGVKKLALKLAKKLDKIEKENKRLLNITRWERYLSEKGYEFIAGIDEAGRGPLAGPVVAAAVILKKGSMIKYVDDSKKLSKEKREELFIKIKEESLSYGVGIVENDVIDEINILNATKLAMKKAIENLKQKPDFLILDAVELKDISIPQKSMIKGDSNSLSVAAASIIAKVTRDSIMKEYAQKFPMYAFEQHKGYGTNTHYDALRIHGLCSIHRKTFLKNIIK